MDYVTFKVPVEVSSKDISEFRKQNKGASDIGVLSHDRNIRVVLAINKAQGKVGRLDSSVEVKTTLDPAQLPIVSQEN